MNWFQERKGFQGGKEIQRQEMKGLKDRKKLFRGGKKSSSMGQEFLKFRIIGGVGIGSTSNLPPPLPTTQTEERLHCEKSLFVLASRQKIPV